MTALIELRDIRKSFGPVEVLKGVDMEVHPGRVSALVGDNGAGKSTLIKGLAGAQSYDSGEVFFEGQPVTLHSPQDAAALGIEVVYQDLALCENLDIVQNMFLGREEKHHRMLNGPEMERHAATTLASLSVRTITSVGQKVFSLSGGQGPKGAGHPPPAAAGSPHFGPDTPKGWRSPARCSRRRAS